MMERQKEFFVTNVWKDQTTWYAVVEARVVPGPEEKAGHQILKSYQIGIVERGTQEPILKFRVDYTYGYVMGKSDVAEQVIMTDDNLHDRACTGVMLYLWDSRDYSPPQGHVQGITAIYQE